jgi:DNA-binding NarL/FixJ family response regulator
VLSGALDALAAGAPTWLCVEGEPGIGKTRLLAELGALADARGHIVLTGAAAEFERDVPFSVWADALDAYAASRDLQAAPGYDAELGAELAGMLPSTGRAGGATAPVALADERYRAHRAMRRLLESLAAQRPLVLVLDDLHWCDRASAELIAALARRGPAAPVLLALGFRRGQEPERIRAALGAPHVRRLSLAPLTEAQAAQLLGGADAATAAALYRHSGGNPFYLEQLARARDGDHLTKGPAAPGAPAAVPAAVAASLADELAALGTPVRALLDAAAVAGEPFEADLASAVAELAPEAGLDALDDLLARDLIRPTEVPQRFGFRHPLVRSAVYASIRGGSKLAAHRRAAAVLTARGAGPTEIAHHVEVSATPGDDAAITLLDQAAAASTARAPAAAARWLHAVLALLPAADAPRRLEAHVALASVQRSLGDLEACRSTLVAALELVDAGVAAGGDAALRADLTARCAAVEHWLGRHGEAHARLVGAWDALADEDTPEAISLQIELAIDGFYERDLDHAITMAEQALRTAQDLDDAPLIGAAAAALALAESAAGHIPAAREHHALAVAVVDALPDAQLAPWMEALYYLGWADTYLEHYDAALAHVDRGIALARATGEGRLLIPLLLVKPYALEMQGRIAEAIEVCESAVEAAGLSDNPHYLFWALFELGFARYFAGDLDGAIAEGEESARVGHRLAGGTIPAAGGGPGWQLGCALFEAGRVAEAREAMHALGSDELEHKIPVERNFDWEILALVELALGHHEEADGYVRRAEANAERLGLELPRALAARARAAVLLATGRPEEAVEQARAAVAGADAIGARLIGAFAQQLLGEALDAAGDRAGAIATWRAAEHELEAIGSLRERDVVRRALRKRGARVEPRGPASGELAGVGALSPREREIAELVTDRRTNKEIAAALFLSDKTIESHLRNIFIKLGVSSRVEVARAIERAQRETET